MGIETTLLALGASASTAATAASVGSVIGTGFSAFSALSSVAGGMSSNREAAKQGAMAQAQANLQAEETARAGVRDAAAVGMEADSVRRRQKLAYLKSGVDLTGSPLLMMEATRRNGLDNVEEVLRSSGQTAGSQIVEGRARATALKSSGRQAFMSGLGNAATSLARLA